MMGKIDQALFDKIDTIVKSMGYEFVGGEIASHGRRALLRIYADKVNGITADDCSLISRQLSAMLDVEDPIHGQYTLEVSSPGIDRPLFVPRQYEAQIGQTIKVKLRLPLEGRRQYQGVLQKVDQSMIIIKQDGAEKEINIPFSMIDKANLVGVTSFKR